MPDPIPGGLAETLVDDVAVAGWLVSAVLGATTAYLAWEGPGTTSTVADDPRVVPGDDPRLRRWAALMHDLGKPAVRHVKPNGEWGFYKHETAGAEPAARRGRAAPA